MERNMAYKFMTVTEVAERMRSMDDGESLDFTFDTELSAQEEPTGWFGFKKVELFDEPHGNIAMGDYGAAATNIYSLQDNSLAEIETAIHELLNMEEGREVDIICVEIPVKELWEEFGAVPMNAETECLEEEWNGFPIGTHREEVWHWFEETFNISVAELMYH